MTLRFCPACRGLVLAEFRFCPHCGAAVKGPGLDEALGAPFDRMDSAASDRASPGAPPWDGQGAPPWAAQGAPLWAASYDRARDSLERLEADMDLLIEELEREANAGS
jgi:hypothetical protein